MSFLDALTPSFRVPAECVVLVGDDQHEMSDLYDYLTEVTVESSRKDAATARLQFETRRDEQGHFIVQDDPDIADLRVRMQENRFSKLRAFVGWLMAIGPLRDDMDIDEAAATVGTRTSPEVNRMLRDARGCSAQRYELWLARTLLRVLLP